MHPWFTQYNKDATYNDNISYDDIPIYSNVLNLLEEFRFNKKDAEKYIRANKHNHETTTYYLLLKKHEREGKPLKLKYSEEDVSVEDDERNQTQPPRYPQNLSVSQKIRNEYLPKSQLNQTLPVSSRPSESLTGTRYSYANPGVPTHQIYLETSRAEQQAGINVSYDNSFTAIKRDIQKTVGEAKRPGGISSLKETTGIYYCILSLLKFYTFKSRH